MSDNVFFLQWHITHTCNLRCVHCYQDEYTSHMTENVMYKALDSFSELLAEKGIQGQINLTGGEPLLHPSFYSLAEEIVQRGIRLGILTNGTLIDEDAAKRIAKLKPVFVQVSLDGTEKIHDRIRGKGNYSKAMNGIDLLKKNRVKVLVSFTAQKSNVKSYEDLARDCRAHGVDKLWWDRVVIPADEDTKKLSLSTYLFTKLCTTCAEVKKKYRFLFRSSMISNSRALQFLYDLKAPVYQCSAGKNLLVLLADGNIMPCRRLPFTLGNIESMSFSEAVNAPLMSQLALPIIPKGCESCKYRFTCMGGAKCVSYAATGKLHIKDVNCPI